MAGQIRKIIDVIIKQKSKDNPILINTTKTKLLLKGIDPDSYTANSNDDPNIIDKLANIAKEFGINI